MDRGKSSEDDSSVHLQIVELQRLSGAYGSSTTIFEPQGGIEKRDSSFAKSVNSPVPVVRAPEKKLTLFALRLAVLEKAATSLGTLGFIWATVVLLGGFAIVLDRTDFWFITVILLIEGTRIFSRSHELEWQHQATWSVADAGINSFRALRSSSHLIVETAKAIFSSLIAARKQSQLSISREVRGSSDGANTGNCDVQRKQNRTWRSSEVPILPYGQWFFLSRNISKLLYWLQIASATTCVVLSLMKLIRHDYGEVEKGDTDKRNRKTALFIFYSLALAEASLFLMEKAYWEWKVIYRKLLDEVNNECELGPSGMISIRRFFYDAYSKCVYGSIFDGLKMDMVTFGMDLLASSSPDEKLIGVRILHQFATNDRFSDDTLQKIGTNIEVMDRLIEILNWKDPQEEEIRRSAAEILSKLAGKKQNSLRVAGIPGAMESISSLLQTNRTYSIAADEIGEKQIVFDHANYAFWQFNHLGLLILKKLARDHDNCGKIGNTRGLLPKIIDFTHAEERLLKDENAAASQILTVKRSLQLVKMLTSTTGATGRQLRKEISEIVFTISNIRDILRHGEKHPMLQKLGIEILTGLALEEEATEKIGGTGGVLKELLNIFFNQETLNPVRTAAGEALAMLALESKSNCHRILKLKVIERLVQALEVPSLRVNAARIVRNLCAYEGGDCFKQLQGITTSAPTVLEAIMTGQGKFQEVMVGLAAEVFKYMTGEESRIMFERAGILEADLANKMVQILKTYEHPRIKVPRIRRFAIELAIWMMRENASNVRVFRDLGLESELEAVLETTAQIESFNIFSGTVGLSRHSTTIHSLVETALKLLAVE
ncbi:hypothetical protein K2173_017622 [Erythroxylum novogranatense]|uniref:ARM repeat superfamily protein n=1 Tax=Erythroxylum novogranatense TaxID=1862640 RepID=A0AAV8TNW0_9ROSI|nr:hypothetical protein K2173_017622 [Erythroxylum novogranatense]